LKRGFTYFGHEAGLPFRTDESNANQLLVAASSNDFDSDTHWHRADVDSFLFQQAIEAGVECFENIETIEIDRSKNWPVRFDSPTGSQSVKAKWCIDASGAGQVLLRHLQIKDETHRLQTNSRVIYSHWQNVRPFTDVLCDLNIDTSQHPYPCDNAAVHHLFDDGWMWNLRFNDGTVSAGVVTANQPQGASPGSSATSESEASTLRLMFERYPSLQAQFANAEPIKSIGLRTTNRLQRLAAHAAGENWFALPNTVGFIDPLHSTGIAHTLSAVERIANLFANDTVETSNYDQAIRNELLFVDELVSGCYASLGNFELFTTWTMLYFAAAHSCELRRVNGEPSFENGFLGAAIPGLRSAVQRLRPFLDQAVANPSVESIAEFQRRALSEIEPYNAVGLLDPATANMYANTAPPRAN
ncbi:MAG: NAD(P)/FAD-dependent oxidoreductase, partial [Planctomycetaceae bacterium]